MIGKVIKMDPAAMAEMDKTLLGEDGKLRILPASVYKKIPHEDLIAWGHRKAYYGFPTQELCIWLLQVIAGRSAIEIGCGHGVLGKYLTIPCTDSKIQARPDIIAHYKSMGQPIIDYPPHVEKLEAMDAVTRYRPRVVIASWVTQRFKEGDQLGNGLVDGVDEEELIKSVDCYIHIGHDNVHGKKRIKKYGHEEHRLPFLYSRAIDPTGNVINIWRR